MAKIFDINGKIADESCGVLDWGRIDAFHEKMNAYISSYNREMSLNRDIMDKSLSEVRRMLEKAGACGTVKPAPYLVSNYGKPAKSIYRELLFRNVYSICYTTPCGVDGLGYMGKLEIKKKIDTHTFMNSVEYRVLLYRYNPGMGIYEKYQEEDSSQTGSFRWIPVQDCEAMEITDRQMADLAERDFLWPVYEELREASDGIVTDDIWDGFLRRNEELFRLLDNPVADRTLHPAVNIKKADKEGIQAYLVPNHASGMAVSYENGRYELHLYGPEKGTDYIDQLIRVFLSEEEVFDFISDNLDRAFYPGNTYIFPLSMTQTLCMDGLNRYSEINFDDIKSRDDYSMSEMEMLDMLESYSKISGLALGGADTAQYQR